MARSFDPAGGADSITFATPASIPPDQGPITIAVLAQAADTVAWTGWMVRGYKAGTPILGFLTSNNAGAKLFAENDFGAGVAGRSTAWRWYVMTKASGNVAPRIHVGDPTGTPSWAHTDNTAGVLDGTGPIDTLVVGGTGGGSNGWRGPIMVAAMADAVWTDAQIEARCTMAALDLFTAVNAATKKWMVRLNQASTATTVTDDTGGGGDQTAISGTTVVADLAGFDYSISGPTGPAATLWNGTAEVPVNLSLWNGTAEVPVTFELAP